MFFCPKKMAQTWDGKLRIREKPLKSKFKGSFLMLYKIIQPFREHKKIEFAINHVSLHEKMKPSDHSGTTMLTLSSHVIYMQFREFKYVHPSTNVKKKRCLERINVLKKKQFTISSWKNLPDFHPNLCGFLDSPSIEVAGAVTPGASFTGSLKQLILGGTRSCLNEPSSISIKWEAPFGIHHLEWQKNNMFACSMRLSEMDMHHPIFFTKNHPLKMSTLI